MIARIHILLPYAFALPEKEVFTVYEYEIEGYQVRIYPPERSERADRYSDEENTTIDGITSFNADALRIDFQKEKFDRSIDAPDDPPAELVKKVANDFLTRLRYVTGASKIKLLDFPNRINWRLRYLKDDETELPKEKGLVRGKGGETFHISIFAVNKEIWKDVHSLDPFVELPVWKSLLLDAQAILPEIGPAIVLTNTALEVFISKTLDSLAASGIVDERLWKWINNRGYYLKNPSTEEQYDFLSRFLIGKSIKENSNIWSKFKNLKTARNTFVHNGVAIIGNEMVTHEKALSLIANAKDIINFIKDELPEDLRWPEYKHEIKITLTHTLTKPDENTSQNDT